APAIVFTPAHDPKLPVIVSVDCTVRPDRMVAGCQCRLGPAGPGPVGSGCHQRLAASTGGALDARHQHPTTRCHRLVGPCTGACLSHTAQQPARTGTPAPACARPAAGSRSLSGWRPDTQCPT